MTADENDIASWFLNHSQPDGSIDVRAHILDANMASRIEDFMAQAIPACYISKEKMKRRINVAKLTASEILATKVPDRGSVMAGDFGEVLTLFYLDSERDEIVTKLKKWRYKADRTKAAPHSDVIIMKRFDREYATEHDFVICAEAKLKSTSSNFSPIERSIEGYQLDKTGRLARTLVWLKEKAIDEEKAENIAFVSRFTDGLLDVSFDKKYRAVVIVDSRFLDDELCKEIEIPPQNENFEVIVLGVDDLKNLYEKCFDKALNEVSYAE